MKLMNLEQYVIYGKFLEYLRQNPHITPVRREKDGVMYTWIEDFESNQGFWLSDPQKFEPPPFCPSSAEQIDAEIKRSIMKKGGPLPGFDEFVSEISNE